MINQIRAEFRKVFTIRSTYIILAIMLALIFFFGFYVGGWHSQKIDLLNPHHLFSVSQQAINFLAILPAVIGLLLFSHEFRHNLASHSLTLSNSRSRVLAAKIVVISVVSLIASAITLSLSPLLSRWGISANHLHLVHQTFYFSAIAWRGLVFGLGYALAGLVLVALIRNQIGSIVALFILPDTIEGLLSIWLKGSTVYLPFSALHSVLGVGLDVSNSKLSPLKSLLVFICYLTAGLIVAWVLFLKRDVVSKDS
jgi:ABC-type transport system involved in multi-copper enzyme maturation permease subunit